MTQDQCEVAALGYEIRLAEEIRREQRPDATYWFATQPRLLPAAHMLCERGWLDRRIGDQPEWRLTDAALFSLRMDSLKDAVSQN